ncbi:MAG: hypothetical protein V7K67_34420 [Nostoc sp.]
MQKTQCGGRNCLPYSRPEGVVKKFWILDCRLWIDPDLPQGF